MDSESAESRGDIELMIIRVCVFLQRWLGRNRAAMRACSYSCCAYAWRLSTSGQYASPLMCLEKRRRSFSNTLLTASVYEADSLPVYVSLYLSRQLGLMIAGY